MPAGQKEDLEERIFDNGYSRQFYSHPTTVFPFGLQTLFYLVRGKKVDNHTMGSAKAYSLFIHFWLLIFAVSSLPTPDNTSSHRQDFPTFNLWNLPL